MEENQNDTIEDKKENGTGASEEAKLAKELENLKQALLYAQAEFENSKKRLQREQDQAIRYANEKLINDLAPVADLFERAMQAAQTIKQQVSGEVDSVLKGVEMTHRELINVLSRFGVEFLGVSGENFDPAKHEAISQIPVEDKDVGKVIQVVERGSLLQGRLIRPAKVIVGTSKEN